MGDKFLKAVPIGRLLKNERPTYCIVFLDSFATLYALRADQVNDADEFYDPADDNDNEDQWQHLRAIHGWRFDSGPVFGDDERPGGKLHAIELGPLEVLDDGAEDFEYNFLREIERWESRSFETDDDADTCEHGL